MPRPSHGNLARHKPGGYVLNDRQGGAEDWLKERGGLGRHLSLYRDQECHKSRAVILPSQKTITSRDSAFAKDYRCTWNNPLPYVRSQGPVLNTGTHWPYVRNVPWYLVTRYRYVTIPWYLVTYTCVMYLGIL